MGVEPRRGSVALLVASLALFACQSTGDVRRDRRMGSVEQAVVGPGDSGEIGGTPQAKTWTREEELVFGGWFLVIPDPEVEEILRRARSLERKEFQEEALRLLDRSIDRSPRSCSLLEARAALYSALGFDRAAERDFETVVFLDAGRARAWQALGRTRMSLGLPNSASDAFAEAARLGLREPRTDLAVADDPFIQD